MRSWRVRDQKSETEVLTKKKSFDLICFIFEGTFSSFEF